MTTERRPTQLISVDVLLFIQELWKEGYRQFPNLKGLSPIQVLARLHDKDERHKLGKEGLRAMLREVVNTGRNFPKITD